MLLKVLTDSIFKVFDEKGNEIPFSHKEVKMYKAKYSSVGNKSKVLFLDGKPLTNLKKIKYRVEYICSCGAHNTILLCKFLEKRKLSCVKCREKNTEKIMWHKKYFELKRKGIERGSKTSKMKYNYNFDLESDEFKEKYFNAHLTEDEFNSILKYLYSIDGIVIKRQKIIFLKAEPSYNAKHYTQKVSIDGIIHPLKNIYLRCPLCGEIFHITRQLKERVKAHNFDCRKCFLNNKTFAVKKYNDILNYQSKPELLFIEECLKRGIEIINGPKIEYTFNDTTHIYTVDFELPKHKLLIEIKDNHVWHQKQVKSGKWTAKEDAAQNYAVKNNKKFHLLFSKDIIEFVSHINI